MKKKLTQEDFEIFFADDSAVTLAFENLLIKWARQVKAGDDSALDSLKWHAHRVLQMIFNLANDGNENAAREFHEIISSHVSQFDKFSHRNAEFFEPIARKTTIWPAFISSDADIEKGNAKLKAVLHLGDDGPLNKSKTRPWSRENPETAVALELWSLLNCYRKAWLNRKATQKLSADDWKRIEAITGKPESWFRAKLPKRKPLSPEMAEKFRLLGESEKLARKLEPLDPQNYPKWYKAAMPAFRALYGEDFQKHKSFAAKYRRSFTRDEQADSKGLKYETWQRQQILTKLEQAFDTIARKN